MKDFLREYWFYIVAPVFVVVAIFVALAFLAGGEDSPFVYNIF